MVREEEEEDKVLTQTPMTVEEQKMGREEEEEEEERQEVTMTRAGHPESPGLHPWLMLGVIERQSTRLTDGLCLNYSEGKAQGRATTKLRSIRR